jgi:hypothetical protein
MPKKIEARMTTDRMEAEALYTRAALKADPDAAELLPLTEGWLERIAGVRQKGLSVRSAEADADALRAVANGRLDLACQGFADRLWLEVGKDAKSPRWTQFFKGAVSRFLRSAFDSQVATVRGWLAGATDALLDQHREGLERWAKAGDEAIIKTRSVGGERGQHWQAREELAEGLTRERDALHDALSGQGRDRGLPRDWPDTFFRRESPSEGPAPNPPAVADPDSQPA